MFSLVYLFIQPATYVALGMSIQITAKEYNQLIRYGHLSTTKQLKQNYKYINIWVIKQIELWRGIKN
jgi:hypothetical protein